MRAAVFKKKDEMAIIDVPNPVAGAGEVVLKVHNCESADPTCMRYSTDSGLSPIA